MVHDSPLTLDEALDILPKVELHCHIEGTMRRTTLVELAARSGRALPSSDPRLLYRFDSLDDFLELYWLAQSCLENRGDWARLAYESVIDGAAHGGVSRELLHPRPTPGGRPGPRGHRAGSRGWPPTRPGRDRCSGHAHLRHGPRLRGPSRPGACRAPGRIAPARRVIGVGMDSTERGIDPADYAPAYRLARASGFHLTAHQGENSPASAIRYDVEVLGVERIDHGVSVLDDPAVARLLVECAIPLTVCPLSNVRIANTVPRLEDHPWPRMAAAGLHLTLNSDDPAFIESDLGN